MPGGKRLWRTAKGDLVEDGHKEAVSLAYGADDTLDKKDESRVRKSAPAPANKKSPASANKQAAKPADK